MHISSFSCEKLTTFCWQLQTTHSKLTSLGSSQCLMNVPWCGAVCASQMSILLSHDLSRRVQGKSGNLECHSWLHHERDQRGREGQEWTWEERRRLRGRRERGGGRRGMRGRQREGREESQQRGTNPTVNIQYKSNFLSFMMSLILGYHMMQSFRSASLYCNDC